MSIPCCECFLWHALIVIDLLYSIMLHRCHRGNIIIFVDALIAFSPHIQFILPFHNLIQSNPLYYFTSRFAVVHKNALFRNKQYHTRPKKVNIWSEYAHSVMLLNARFSRHPFHSSGYHFILHADLCHQFYLQAQLTWPCNLVWKRDII